MTEQLCFSIVESSFLVKDANAKWPRMDVSSDLPIYPHRPGERDCTHYMMTKPVNLEPAVEFVAPCKPLSELEVKGLCDQVRTVLVEEWNV